MVALGRRQPSYFEGSGGPWRKAPARSAHARPRERDSASRGRASAGGFFATALTRQALNARGGDPQLPCAAGCLEPSTPGCDAPQAFARRPATAAVRRRLLSASPAAAASTREPDCLRGKLLCSDSAVARSVASDRLMPTLSMFCIDCVGMVCVPFGGASDVSARVRRGLCGCALSICRLPPARADAFDVSHRLHRHGLRCQRGRVRSVRARARVATSPSRERQQLARVCSLDGCLVHGPGSSPWRAARDHTARSQALSSGAT